MKRISKWPFVLLIVLAVPFLVFAFPDPPARRTGAPGDFGTCLAGGCHTGVLNPGGGKAVVNFPGAMTYTPGLTQHLSVTVSDPVARRWSFQLSARLASNLSNGQAGSFTAVDAARTHVICDGGSCASPTAVQFIQTLDAGTNGTTGSSTWMLDWTPPSSNVGNAALYVVGMGANGFGTSENVYTAIYTLTPTAAPPPTPTLAASPQTLSFAYQTGGATPAAQPILVSSSGTQLTYSATTSGGSWLSATPTTGTTPGTVNVSVNPTGLVANSYNGNVTITASGATGSPQTVAVTLVVSAATPKASMTVSPGLLQFSYQTGGVTPPAQSLMINSTGASLSYLAATKTQSGGNWLTAGPASGTTPGSVAVLTNPSGLLAGTYNGSVTITPNDPTLTSQTVPVTLVVSSSPPASSPLNATPSALTFSGDGENEAPLHKNIKVTSKGAPLNFTATSSDGSWLGVSPTGGATPGNIRVSVNPAGMSAGSYSGTINLSAPGANSISVPITINVSSDEGRGQASSLSAEPYVYDPTQSGALAAKWVDRIGAPVHDGTDATYQGLVLSKNASTSTEAQAGAVIKNAAGLTLTELGFDIRDGGQCSATSPHFVVVTTDGVVHVVGGCGKGTTLPAPAMGWKRIRFDPSKPEQASPPITLGQQVKSLAIMLDQGPETGANAAGGLVVLDNIDINGVLIGKQ